MTYDTRSRPVPESNTHESRIARTRPAEGGDRVRGTKTTFIPYTKKCRDTFDGTRAGRGGKDLPLRYT
ncbi:hypothetical protein GCM10023096_04960 [Nonomuraea ferruginea]